MQSKRNIGGLGSKKQPERAVKLAEALRRNLVRRKAQGRLETAQEDGKESE